MKTMIVALVAICGAAGCSVPGGTAGFSVSVTMPPTSLQATPLNVTANQTQPSHTMTLAPMVYAQPSAAPAGDAPGVKLQAIRPMPCPE